MIKKLNFIPKLTFWKVNVPFIEYKDLHLWKGLWGRAQGLWPKEKKDIPCTIKVSICLKTHRKTASL